MPSKNRKSKKSVTLDLSEVAVSESGKKFVVESYDYAELQTEKSLSAIQFEDDLKYLLSNEEQNILVDVNFESTEREDGNGKITGQMKENSSRNARTSSKDYKPHKISRAEITRDIDEICFSSDDEELESQEKKKKREKKKDDAEKNMNGHTEDTETDKNISGVEVVSGGVIKEIDAPKGNKKESKKDQIQVSDDNQVLGSEESPASNERTKKKKRKPKAEKTETEATKAENEDNVKASIVEATQSLESEVSITGVVGTESELLHPKQKKKRSQKARAKRLESEASGIEADSNEVADSNNPMDVTKTDGEGQEGKGILQEPAFPKLRSSKTAVVAQFPEIHPIKTIIGVSHHQIMNMRISDVKFKIITTLTLMSKISKNALQFLVRDDVFTDDDLKRKFLHACILVALHEAKGFHNISRKYPGLDEWLSNYQELTLSHTRANLTVSNRAAHQNDLDYNLFSYLGHILIWANHLQTTGGMPTVMEKYDFDVTRNDIMLSIGGFHLWDRVRREIKTMNTKRWKHIQKYRMMFPYEEDQFVAMLRILDLGLQVP